MSAIEEVLVQLEDQLNGFEKQQEELKEALNEVAEQIKRTLAGIKALDPTYEEPQRMSVVDKILEYVPRNQPLNLNAIEKILSGGIRRGTITTTLSLMKSRGQVESPSRGVYIIKETTNDS